MPTLFRIDGYRFFFFSDEHTPEHIHIEKGDSYARVEIKNLKVTDSYSMNTKELKKLLKIIKENSEKLQGDWDDYFK